MPSISETRQLPYSPEQLFNIVADVEKYPDFLPWVVATRVTENSETRMKADMLVGFKAIREKFTSEVDKDAPNSIRVHYIDGPLKDLDNLWTFKTDEQGGCELFFSVEFSFKSKMFEALAGQYIDRAFRKMVAAFEERAELLYGKSNSSAQSVA